MHRQADYTSVSRGADWVREVGEGMVPPLLPRGPRGGSATRP